MYDRNGLKVGVCNPRRHQGTGADTYEKTIGRIIFGKIFEEYIREVLVFSLWGTMLYKEGYNSPKV